MSFEKFGRPKLMAIWSLVEFSRPVACVDDVACDFENRKYGKFSHVLYPTL